MSVRVQTVGATQLELVSPSAPAVKRNFTLPISVGGASGQVVGGYLGAFIKLPASFTTADNQQAIMFGADTDRDGVVNETNESGLIIGGPTSGTAPRRPRWRFATANVNSENMTQMTLDRTHLVLKGLTNRGSNGTPVWIQWIAYCDTVTGNVHSWTQAHSAAFLTSTTHSVLATIFMAAATALSRTPVNIEQEHIVWVDGDFPWDTANNGSTTGSVAGAGRPHHDAIRALCGFGGTHTWATLVAAQNAGTLGYSNLRSNGDAVDPRPGRANVTEWFKLANLSDLANYGSNSGNSLTVVNYNSLSNGLVSGSTAIAPAHWAPAGPAIPTINTPRRLFTAGRGLLPTVRTGTYDAVNTTALQRRWIYGDNPLNEGAVAGEVVPGFGWSAAGITLDAGNFTCTTLLPRGGPYTLQVRDANAPLVLSSPQTDTLVGMRVLMHGPSSMALSIRGGNDTALGPNWLNISAAPGVLAQVMRLDDMLAGNNSTYTRPQAIVGTIRGGETPAIGHGAILLANEWFVHNPREPIDLCNMAINTHGMDLWVSNAANPSGHPSWKFLGPLTLAPPGVSDGNASGVVNYYGWMCAESNGVDLHVLMWFGGISASTGAAGDLVGSGTGRMGYRAAIDARFPASPNAPWVIYPSWRIHRSSPDTNAGPTPRNDHVLMVQELNAVTPGRGILGPTWNDIISDGNGGAHPCFRATDGAPALDYVSDANWIGQGRLGPSLARTAAWAFDRRIKAFGPRLVRAYFADGTRNAIVLELARACRTLGGAALYAGQFWISTNDGGLFINTGFTAALSADGLRVTLTTTGAAFPATNVRAEVHWFMPFGPNEVASEGANEVNIRGLLYDNQTYRGAVNFAAGLRAGNVLQGTSRAGAGLAGVPVTAKSTPKVLATETFSGSRAPVIRMRVISTGQVVDKAIPITATA